MDINDPIKTTQFLPDLWFATYGDYDLDDPVGSGKTAALAIQDLKEIRAKCERCDGERFVMAPHDTDGIEHCPACDGVGYI